MVKRGILKIKPTTKLKNKAYEQDLHYVIYGFPGRITKKFTGYLQYLHEEFTCYLHDLSPLL